MSILNKLSSAFSIDVKESPSSKDEVSELIKFSSIQVPEEYITLLSEGSELEILVNNEKYIRIWGASGCIEMNEAYNIQSYIPSSLAIGDDEGGSVLIYLTRNEGFGLYITGFGDLDPDEATFVAPSLCDLLINNIGINKL